MVCLVVAEDIANAWERTCTVGMVSRRFPFTTTLSFSSIATMDSSLVNGGSAPTHDANASRSSLEEEDVDPIWLSSRTARQIYGLCQVERVSAIYHLTLDA